MNSIRQVLISVIGLTMMPVEVAKYQSNVDLKAQSLPVWGCFILASCLISKREEGGKEHSKHYSDSTHTVNGIRTTPNCSNQMPGLSE